MVKYCQYASVCLASFSSGISRFVSPSRLASIVLDFTRLILSPYHLAALAFKIPPRTRCGTRLSHRPLALRQRSLP